MKKSIIYFGLSAATFLAFFGTWVWPNAATAHAQMMGGYGQNGSSSSVMGGWAYPGASSTQMSASDTQAIAAGQALYSRLQSRQIACSELTRDNYDELGEYFMQQVTGAGHPAMDAMISNMMGEEGDTAIHVAWGERYSGCNTNATLPGAWSTPGNNNHYDGFMPMMGFGYGYGGGWDIFGLLWTILWWTLVIVSIVVLVRWLRYGHRHHHGWYNDNQNAISILKERYAKGEISKKEFEEIKKDLDL